MKNNNNKGFTLIELMITVSVVGILAAVAIPAYQNYVVRSQVTEGFSLLTGHKVGMADFYAKTGDYPETLEEMGAQSLNSKLIERTQLGTRGKIQAVFSQQSNIPGKFMVLEAVETDTGSIAWDCFANIEIKYLPSSCEGVIYNSDGSYFYKDGFLEITSEQREKYKSYRYKNPYNNKSTDPLVGHIDKFNRDLESYKSMTGLDRERHGKYMVWTIEVLSLVKKQAQEKGEDMSGFPTIPVFKPAADDKFDYEAYIGTFRRDPENRFYDPNYV